MTCCSSLYCCSLWSAYDYTTLRSIHVAHNDVLRFMFHLPRYTRVSNIFVSLNIPNFSVLRRKLVYSMYKRVLASSNSLARTLWTQTFLWHLGFLNSGCKYFLAIMCVRLHLSKVTTHLCFLTVWHLGFLNSGCKYFLAIMCVRLHFSKVTTHLCFLTVFLCICIYTLYSMDYCLQIKAFNQSIQSNKWVIAYYLHKFCRCDVLGTFTHSSYKKNTHTFSMAAKKLNGVFVSWDGRIKR